MRQNKAEERKLVGILISQRLHSESNKESGRSGRMDGAELALKDLPLLLLFFFQDTHDNGDEHASKGESEAGKEVW